MPDPGQQNQQQQPQAGAGGVRGLQPPPNLIIDEKVGTSWPLWKQRYQLYSKASGLSSQPKDIQSSTLLHVLGEEALAIYNTFNFGEENAEDPKVLFKFYERYFLPKKNVTLERHVFNTRFQQPSEPFDNFVTDIKLKAKTCEFAALNDSLIKDRIVVGITDDSVRSRLLRDADLDLQKAIDICHSAEQASAQMGTLSGTSAKIDTVNTQRGGPSCKSCGRKHPPRRCPAYGKTCRDCGEQNHFSYMCKNSSAKSSSSTGRDRDRRHDARHQDHSHRREEKRGKNNRRRGQKKMHDVELNEDTSSSDYSEQSDSDVFVGEAKSSKKDAWYVHVKLDCNNKMHNQKFKLDTGAECNILTEKTFRNLGLDTKILKPTKNRLISWSGHAIKPIGQCSLVVEYKDRYYTLEFIVVKGNFTQVLGLDTCNKLSLIKKIELVQETAKPKKNENVETKYKDVFQGLGCVDETIHLTF